MKNLFDVESAPNFTNMYLNFVSFLALEDIMLPELRDLVLETISAEELILISNTKCDISPAKRV